MKKSQKSEKTIMFYVKNCKNDALLMVNLQRECFFDPRNPRGTLFRAGSLFATNTPLYYLVHENPYQHSCWGKTWKNEISRFSKNPNIFRSIIFLAHLEVF